MVKSRTMRAVRSLASGGLAVVALCAGLMVVGLVVAGPAGANSYCNTYCSGPHKAYDSCMRECIGRQEYRDPRDAHRAIRDLCSGPGHDERECRNEYRAPRPPHPGYGNGYGYAPPVVVQRPMRCWEDYRGQLICRPE